MIGETLKHYKIVSQIGSGGMGEVYIAEDTKLERKVALKVLSANMASDADRRTRFEREAKAVAALNHPNIVTVYSVEQEGDTQFITMELVEGQNFTELLTDKRLPLNKFMEYSIALADALTGAHRKGITHRDLKPDNVMLGEDGRVKVLDFGLAKIADGGLMQESAQTVTQEGTILGTVAYMAPEQAEGKPADTRSDIFSLGVILYQMTTSQNPFQGDTTISTITSILRDTPQPVTSIDRSLPRHLGRIIKRCLEKDPEMRYQTAQDLRNDLQGLREEMESGETLIADRSAISAASAARSRGPNRWLVATLGIVALAAIAIAVWQFAGGRAAKQAVNASASRENMEIVRLTATGSSREATISPDGRYVAYMTDDAGLSALWVTQVATGSRVQIVPPEDVGIWDPIFSPDGDFIYYCRMKEGEIPPDLYRVATLGGPTRKVMDDVTGRVSFAPDGQRFVFFRGSPTQSKLVVSNVDGTEERVVATVDSPKNYDDPTWSPDGKIIAASLRTFDEGPATHIIGVSPDGGDERHLSEASWFDIGEIAWLPDGSGVIINGQSLDSVQLWDVMVPSGETRRVTNDLNSYHGVGVTADGSTLVTQLVESIFHIWNYAADGTDPVRITKNVAGNDGDGLAWLPDGRLAYDTVSGGNLEIWTVNADGTDARRLIANGALNAGPVVTADGKYVVYMSTLSKTVNIWRANLDGSNPVQLTHGSLEIEPRLSPDGKWVLFQEAQTGSLHRIPIDGGDATVVREKRGGTGEVSPDGRLIMAPAIHAEKNRMVLEIIPFDGGDPLHTFDLGEEMRAPHWSPDGRFVTYVREENDVENLWRIPIEGGEPEQLTHFDADRIREFAWSPDGKRMVVSRGRVNNDIVLLKNFR